MGVFEDERVRAAEYRRMMQAREDEKLARERRMVGPSSALASLRENFTALLPWRGWDAVRKVKQDAEE